MDYSLAVLEDILSNDKLREKPKAFMLLKLSQLSQIFYPDRTMQFWEQLDNIKHKLPSKEQELYKNIQESLNLSEGSKVKGFTAEISQKIKSCRDKADSSPREAAACLKTCEERISKRKWPFGKRPAWEMLVQACCEIDRKSAMRLINKVSKNSSENIIQRLNAATPLTSDEWDKLYKKLGGDVVPIIKNMLDQSKVNLNLSSELAKKVSGDIIQNILIDKDENPDTKPDQALEQFERLIYAIDVDNPELAGNMVKSLYRAIYSSGLFEEKFESGFMMLRSAINIWARTKKADTGIFEYITKETPDFLRDFAMSQWLGLVSETEEDAVENLSRLSDMAANFRNAEAWFLVILVSRGMGEIAMKLAKKSNNSKDLIPRMRCALVSIHQELAHKLLKPEDFGDDLIGQFLLMESGEKRIAFLREHIEKDSGLLNDLWKKPDFLSIEKKERGSLYHFYSKNTRKEEQFEVILRLKGYYNYSYADIDIFLLATLCQWGDEEPEKVNALLKRIWEQMRPDESEISIDLFRNTIFERCRIVLCADVSVMIEFITWVKKKLVDNVYQWQLGQTMYTLSLKSETLFLFCLIGAEKVKRFSGRRADEIIAHALENYTAEGNIMKYAAELFAGDKGFEAIEPPVKLKKHDLDNWQLAIIQSVLPHIVDAFAREKGAAVGTAAGT